MSEIYHQKQTQQEGLTNNQFELIDIVLNEVYTNPSLNLKPKNGILSKDPIKKISDMALHNFEAMMNSTGYYPGEEGEAEELTDGIFSLVKFSLLAPGHMTYQIDKRNSDNNEHNAFLCAFNHATKEAIENNPGIKRSDLQKVYTSMFDWGNIHKSFKSIAEENYDDHLRGIESELAFKQIVTGQPIASRGVSLYETTVEEDLKKGIDYKLGVPLGDEIVDVGVDVKASRRSVPVDGGKYTQKFSDDFGVVRGKIVLYVPVRESDMGSGFTLQEDVAHTRSETLAPQIPDMAIALKQYRAESEASERRRIERSMGYSATRVA